MPYIFCSERISQYNATFFPLYLEGSWNVVCWETDFLQVFPGLTVLWQDSVAQDNQQLVDEHKNKPVIMLANQYFEELIAVSNWNEMMHNYSWS